MKLFFDVQFLVPFQRRYNIAHGDRAAADHVKRLLSGNPVHRFRRSVFVRLHSEKRLEDLAHGDVFQLFGELARLLFGIEKVAEAEVEHGCRRAGEIHGFPAACRRVLEIPDAVFIHAEIERVAERDPADRVEKIEIALLVKPGDDFPDLKIKDLVQSVRKGGFVADIIRFRIILCVFARAFRTEVQKSDREIAERKIG